MQQKNVIVGLIQIAAGTNPEENFKKALSRAEQAAIDGSQIICLPELYRTRYFAQGIGVDTSMLAETIPGVSTRAFSEIARHHHVVIIVPLYEKGADGRFYNSVVIIDADGTLHTPYHKVHIPQDPGFYEKGYFYPGDSYRVHSTRYGRIAVLICYDQWFPEAARSVALDGAEIIFYPTAIGHPSSEEPAEGAGTKHGTDPAWSCCGKQCSHYGCERVGQGPKSVLRDLLSAMRLAKSSSRARMMKRRSSPLLTCQ
jgi:agmatine deiminase